MTTLCTDVANAISEAVDASLRETFEMMIGETVTLTQTSCTSPTSESRTPDAEDCNQVTVVVGLSGGLQGSVSLCLDTEAAFLWTRKLIDHETDRVDQTVIDGIGELGNMVVGGAKGRLEDHMLTLGLPCVVLAGKSRLAFPTNSTPVELQYDLNGHGVTVFISLIEVG